MESATLLKVSIQRAHAPEKGGRRRAQSWLVSIFCPRALGTGRLAKGYVEFQSFDTLQALCSYLRGVFCNRALLRAVGVGNETASATAATLTFLTKDGAGMLASLLLAFAFSNSFGRRVKFWRLFADIVNDLALVIDLFGGSWAGNALLLAMCLSSALKAMCGVAAGATRAAITNHFALDADDLADIAAKEGSQETAVTLLGMLAGYLALQQVQDETLVWYLFWFLTAVHVWANWRAVRSLHFRTLDWERLAIVSATSARSFEQVSRMEPILFMRHSAPRQLDDGKQCAAAVVVNSHLPNIVLELNEQGTIAAFAIGHKCADASQVVCVAIAYLQRVPAHRAHECLTLVHELRDQGWDLEASATLLGDNKQSRVKITD